MSEQQGGDSNAEHSEGRRGTGAYPKPEIQQNRTGLTMIWLVPIVAALIGIALVVRHFLDTGPEVTILFRTAEGIQPGRTELRYKEVVVGQVTGIRLVQDGTRVSVTARLDKNASEFAVEDARYWVTRPRVGTGGVSGLGTLLSGAYIGVDRGASQKSAREFVGLESPPLVLRGDSGRQVSLKAADIGSLDFGSPVYYRNMKAGRVMGYALGPQGAWVDLQLFVDAPFDQLITTDTRFWNASGMDVSVGAGGFKVDSQSLLTIIAGGVSFGFPSTPGQTTQAIGAPAKLEPAPKDHVFQLFDSPSAALAPPDGESTDLLMVFEQNVRGLTAGAQVEFAGVNIGNVTQVTLSYDQASGKFPAIVRAQVFPDRLGPALQHLLTAVNPGAAQPSSGPESRPADVDGESTEAQRTEAARKSHTQGKSQGNTQEDITVSGLPIAELGTRPMPSKDAEGILRKLIERGLRAQLRSANLLTGQLYVAINFEPNAPKPGPSQMTAVARGLAQIPTIPAPFSQIELQIAEIIEQVRRLNLDRIGNDVQKTLEELQLTMREGRSTLGAAGRTMGSADVALKKISTDLGHTLDSLQRTLGSARDNMLASDAPVQRNLNETLEQLQRTARSLRALTDDLQRHPDSLIRGRSSDRALPALENR